MLSWVEPTEDLVEELEDLLGLIEGVDHDLATNCKLLNSNIKSLERRLASVPAHAPMSIASLT